MLVRFRLRKTIFPPCFFPDRMAEEPKAGAAAAARHQCVDALPSDALPPGLGILLFKAPNNNLYVAEVHSNGAAGRDPLPFALPVRP
jgi:hypothetical protein